jgi:hypothetical protein
MYSFIVSALCAIEMAAKAASAAATPTTSNLTKATPNLNLGASTALTRPSALMEGEEGEGEPPRGLRASAHAPGSQQPAAGGQQSRSMDPAVEWHSIVASLTRIGDDLGKAPRKEVQRAVYTTLRRLKALGMPPQQAREDTVDKRLKSLERKIDTIIDGTKTQKGQTWASIAAAAAQPPRAVIPITTRTAVRVRIPEAEGKTPAELLDAVKPVIQGAYAVRQLRSGDVEVMDIHLANRRIIPNLAINKIRWLHDDKTQAERKLSGKTRGSVIVSLPTQAIQQEVIRRGLVISSQLYETRLYSQGLEAKLCFNCSQWGHTQAACGKRARCGECAGPHQTRECQKERVSCCNCGKAHRAWQRRLCRTFQAYFEDIQPKRTMFFLQTAAIRNGGTPQPTLNLDAFEVVGSKKRGRVLTPSSTLSPSLTFSLISGMVSTSILGDSPALAVDRSWLVFSAPSKPLRPSSALSRPAASTSFCVSGRSRMWHRRSGWRH